MATQKDSVRIMSFISGQEVIGELTWKDGGYAVKNPFLIQLQQGPGGNIAMGLIPWPLLANPSVVKETGVNVYSDALACEPYTPNDQLLTGYMERVTGLTLPAKSPIIWTE